MVGGAVRVEGVRGRRGGVRSKWEGERGWGGGEKRGREGMRKSVMDCLNPFLGLQISCIAKPVWHSCLMASTYTQKLISPSRLLTS